MNFGIKKVVFSVIYILISGILLSYWLFNDVWGNLELKIAKLIIFIALMLLNIPLVIYYIRRGINKVFMSIFIIFTILLLLSVPVRNTWIEIMYTRGLNRSINDIQYQIQRYLEFAEDYNLKGTVDGKRIGIPLINGSNLDEEGRHYFEITILSSEIKLEDNDYGPLWSEGVDIFNPDEWHKECIKNCIIGGRISNYFIKYKSDSITKSQKEDYKFFAVIDSSKSIKNIKERIELVLTTGEIPKWNSKKNIIEGEVIVFKH